MTRKKRKWAEINTLAETGEFETIKTNYPAEWNARYKTLKQMRVDAGIKPSDLDIPHGAKVGLWYYGSTGVGKTRTAVKEYPLAFRKEANNKWWDGYNGEDSVIMDDIDKSHHYMGYHLKKWVDRYAFQAEVKGSSMLIRPKVIIVTSNYHPRDIFTDESVLPTILRRFKVTHFISMDEALGLELNDEVRVADLEI